MSARQKDGHLRVYTRDGAYYVLAADQYALVRDAWMRGAAFVDTVSLHGEPTTIKGAEIQGVRLVSAASFAAAVDDDLEFAREQKQREMLEGGE